MKNMNQGEQPCKTSTFCPDLDLCPIQTCYKVCKDLGKFLRSVFASFCDFWLGSDPEGATMRPSECVFPTMIAKECGRKFVCQVLA